MLPKKQMNFFLKKEIFSFLYKNPQQNKNKINLFFKKKLPEKKSNFFSEFGLLLSKKMLNDLGLI